ncbi:hypothetical protein [Desulfofundulus sp.]|uniref:hypothetical protein n=1 Tax=Desulfofundulus sp. TaxID=2282750 RepID=UPI003C7590F4
MDADAVIRRIAAVLLQRAFIPDDAKLNGITLTTIARLVHDYLSHDYLTEEGDEGGEDSGN